MKKYLMIFAVLLLCAACNDDDQEELEFNIYTAMDDENFISACKANYNINGGKNVLTIAEAAAVSRLDVSRWGVSSLKGIEYFTGLTTLVCLGNLLQTLDVSKNTNLLELHCDINQLQTLDLSANTMLEFLSCSDNQLQTLDLSANTMLEFLFCSTNQLKALDISANTELRWLYAQDNLFTEIIVWKGFSSAVLDIVEIDPGVTFKEKE